MRPAGPHRSNSADLHTLRLPPTHNQPWARWTTKLLCLGIKIFIDLKYLFNTETTEANFCQVLSVIRSTLHTVSVCSGWRGQHDGCESLSRFPTHSPIGILMREPEHIPVPLCSRPTAPYDCSVATTSSLKHHVALLSQRNFTSNKWSQPPGWGKVVEERKPKHAFIISHLLFLNLPLSKIWKWVAVLWPENQSAHSDLWPDASFPHTTATQWIFLFPGTFPVNPRNGCNVVRAPVG